MPLTCQHSHCGSFLCRSEIVLIMWGGGWGWGTGQCWKFSGQKWEILKNCWLLCAVRSPAWFLWSDVRLLLTKWDLQSYCPCLSLPVPGFSQILLTNKFTITSRFWPAGVDLTMTKHNIFWCHSFILLLADIPARMYRNSPGRYR